MTDRIELSGGAVLFALESRTLPIVSISLSTRSGSVHDPADSEGLLRTSLRMLRRGAAGMSANDIETALDTLGAELSIDVGPSTTTIYAQVISRNVERLCALLCKLLSSPTLAEDELARLIRETHAEITESRDNDRSLAERAFRRTLFEGHPYGRSTRGSHASIDHIERDGVARALKQHLVKGNVAIAIAGDATVARAKELAETLVAALPDGARVDDPTPEPQALPGKRLVFVDKPERTQTQVLIGGIGTSARDEDHTALLVGNAVFGGTFTARLMKEVRSKRGWSYGASSRLGVDRRRQSFAMWTFPGANDAAPCIGLELELLDKWVGQGITARELSFVSKYLVRSYAFDVDTASKRAHQALDVELLGLPADYYDGYTARVAATQLASVNEAIKRRISTRDLVVVVVGTAKASFDAVRAACGELASASVVAFDAD